MAGLTPNQEAFCLAYLETGNAAEAYRRAYDKPENARDNWIYVEASQMLDHPKVSLRIKELQKQASELSIYNVKAAFDEYEEARTLAKTEKNPSAAVAAVNGKVKLFGLDMPTKWKHELVGKGDGPIETKEVGTGSEKLAAVLEMIASRQVDDGAEPS